MDILGQALSDFYHKTGNHKLWIHNKYGPKEEMPVDVYFREEAQMPELEIIALNACRGNILDIGAGAGSHALVLQQRGYDITAIDISELAVTVMQQRGVKKALTADVMQYNIQKYDTLLLMMNGVGLAATVANLKHMLIHLKSLLNPGGQLIFDSSDIAYLYEGNLPDTITYYGELKYQYEYNGQKTNWFNWLYIDQKTFTAIANKAGFNTEILFEDDYDQYLAKLTAIL